MHENKSFKNVGIFYMKIIIYKLYVIVLYNKDNVLLYTIAFFNGWSNSPSLLNVKIVHYKMIVKACGNIYIYDNMSLIGDLVHTFNQIWFNLFKWWKFILKGGVQRSHFKYAISITSNFKVLPFNIPTWELIIYRFCSWKSF